MRRLAACVAGAVALVACGAPSPAPSPAPASPSADGPPETMDTVAPAPGASAVQAPAASASASSRTATLGPTGERDVDPDGAPATPGRDPDADAAIAGLRGRFKRCYQRELWNDASASGKVCLRASVDETGKVTSAKVDAPGFSKEFDACVADAVRSFAFDPGSKRSFAYGCGGEK